MKNNHRHKKQTQEKGKEAKEQVIENCFLSKTQVTSSLLKYTRSCLLWHCKLVHALQYRYLSKANAKWTKLLCT